MKTHPDSDLFLTDGGMSIATSPPLLADEPDTEKQDRKKEKDENELPTNNGPLIASPAGWPRQAANGGSHTVPRRRRNEHLPAVTLRYAGCRLPPTMVVSRRCGTHHGHTAEPGRRAKLGVPTPMVDPRQRGDHDDLTTNTGDRAR